ncbi:Pro-rich N-terminal domain-containing protein [Streptomyces sp. NBS 14/10]|uniref:Pro-rich N-terminal domain-containing protein n=1 Tax=Streptomyces sp. NBS 14/10 TaxID=1945643 RepID=UPI000B7FD59D|nr:Pro-rich N-terminal domain-containing protein [Streptomyces sp. NBS 14/10]KAK1183437.1 Pro-rich N-terminal domain-containing protein [Streptomyces sp. NBS 14/10]
MQHSVGAPLPPPHQPGPAPDAGGAGWAQGTGHHPGPHQAHHPGPHPASPPGSHPASPPGSHPTHPAPPPPVPPAPLHPTPAPPPMDPSGVTGHIQLPPGGPVPLPHPPAGDAAMADASQAAVAVLLIGPAGAGKTTVARHWADRRRVPTAHISLDDVREWVRSGFANPQSGWNENSEAQYRLARRTCGFAARNFLANGISCILDDAVFPDRPVVGLGGWKRHVGPGLLPVVVLPGLEIVLERNAARSGNRRLSDEEVARIHGRMAGWYGSGLPIIDNSTYDVETTARMLDEVVARSIASPPSW